MQEQTDNCIYNTVAGLPPTTASIFATHVKTLMKPMPNAVDDLMHAAVGIAGEAGELLDAVKKQWVYNKPLDMVNMVEELGDLEFYMEALRQNLGLSREVILLQNIEKLKHRYPDGYSDAAAQARADKA